MFSMFKGWLPQQSSYGELLGWCRTSDKHLEDAEAVLLKQMKSVGRGVVTDIGPVVGKDGDYVMTYRANDLSTATPLVLLHGFGCPSALWCLNVDHLAQNRSVYFMDMLGFGRSSRPVFSRDPLKAEDQLVESIEAWRKVVGLKRFILLGHSLGAYLATAYAIKYPDRVVHLILEDPWGFPQQVGRYNNLSIGVLTKWFLSHFVPPLFLLRFLGPAAHLYVNFIKPFKLDNFTSVVEDTQQVYNYFYHSNARNPTGEVAFHSLMRGVAWAKYPMVNRVHMLRADVPMTLLHGQLSWVSKKTSYSVQSIRAGSYVAVQVVDGANHVIHSDQPDEFNSIVFQLMADIDKGDVPSTIAPKIPDIRRFVDDSSSLRLIVEKDLSSTTSGAAVSKQKDNSSDVSSSDVTAENHVIVDKSVSKSKKDSSISEKDSSDVSPSDKHITDEAVSRSKKDSTRLNVSPLVTTVEKQQSSTILDEAVSPSSKKDSLVSLAKHESNDSAEEETELHSGGSSHIDDEFSCSKLTSSLENNIPDTSTDENNLSQSESLLDDHSSSEIFYPSNSLSESLNHLNITSEVNIDEALEIKSSIDSIEHNVPENVLSNRFVNSKLDSPMEAFADVKSIQPAFM